MLNKVWFWLLAIGLLYGFGRSMVQSSFDLPPIQVENRPQVESSGEESDLSTPPGIVETGQLLTNAMIDSAKSAVEICIGLIGIMALWLGLLQIANDAGLVDTFARMLRPLIRWLFPEVPDGHPAQGAILLNLSANMLGLDNAATPMGLKAMKELQDLNPTKDTATNSMAMFLAINTSNVTLIPITIIGYRAIYNSNNPTEPLLGTFLVTLLATIAAVFSCRILAKMHRFGATNTGKDNSSDSAIKKEDE